MHGLKPQPRGWLVWLTTTDHKKIGILYLFATFLFFILGGVEALIMRLQLAQPSGTLVDPETYNGLVTIHGTTMVFLFIVPVLAGFGNYLVPLMIGARDMAFPRLNALSFWLLLLGGLAFYASIFFEPPQAGWTMYPPLIMGRDSGLQNALETSHELREAYEGGGAAKQIIDTALKVENLKRSAGIHAAGVVIGRDALVEWQQRGFKNRFVTLEVHDTTHSDAPTSDARD
jgi:hypothetical protein